jgi:hypothetical protein
MPYFFIGPIYAILLVGLFALSLVLFCFRRSRHLSSYVAVGALGTFPGFVVGNLLFWLVLFAVASIVKKPLDQISSEVVHGVAAVGLVVFVVGGLAVANIGGCLAGFLAGVWVRRKLRRKKVTPLEQSVAGPL